MVGRVVSGGASVCSAPIFSSGAASSSCAADVVVSSWPGGCVVVDGGAAASGCSAAVVVRTVSEVDPVSSLLAVVVQVDSFSSYPSCPSCFAGVVGASCPRSMLSSRHQLPLAMSTRVPRPPVAPPVLFATACPASPLVLMLAPRHPVAPLLLLCVPILSPCRQRGCTSGAVHDGSGVGGDVAVQPRVSLGAMLSCAVNLVDRCQVVDAGRPGVAAGGKQVAVVRVASSAAAPCGPVSGRRLGRSHGAQRGAGGVDANLVAQQRDGLGGVSSLGDERGGEQLAGSPTSPVPCEEVA